MINNSTVTLQLLAEIVGGAVRGEPTTIISGVASLSNAGEGDITFYSNSKFRKLLDSTRASAVIIGEKDLNAWRRDAIVVKDAYVSYAKIAALFVKRSRNEEPGIHPTAVIASTARVASTAYIGPNAIIEAGATIGERVRIGPSCVVSRNAQINDDAELVANVTIMHEVIIGKRTLVHPGAVIGADGFGLAKENQRWIKVPQLGTVVVGEDVEVGANTTIDRGALDNTIIENGVKLDNQIHIAHNVVIGENTAIAANTGISGSTRIGKNCTIAGMVGFAGHITITDNVYITGMSMITKSISEPGVYSSGIPAEPNNVWRRNTIRIRHIDEMEKRLKLLEAQLADVNSSNARQNTD